MINLEKKQTISLEKISPSLNSIHVGLGWDAEDSNGNNIDCDVSVFMINENNKIPNEGCFIFYNNLTSTDGAVVHQGDNTTGEGDGDDEEIHIELNKVSSDIIQMIFVVTIHDAEKHNQDFSMVENAFIRIVNKANNEELLRYDLTNEYQDNDSVQIGRLYFDSIEWHFESLGGDDYAYNGGLQTLLNIYN